MCRDLGFLKGIENADYFLHNPNSTVIVSFVAAGPHGKRTADGGSNPAYEVSAAVCNSRFIATLLAARKGVRPLLPCE